MAYYVSSSPDVPSMDDSKWVDVAHTPDFFKQITYIVGEGDGTEEIPGQHGAEKLQNFYVLAKHYTPLTLCANAAT